MCGYCYLDLVSLLRLLLALLGRGQQQIQVELYTVHNVFTLRTVIKNRKSTCITREITNKKMFFFITQLLIDYPLCFDRRPMKLFAMFWTKTAANVHVSMKEITPNTSKSRSLTLFYVAPEYHI